MREQVKYLSSEPMMLGADTLGIKTIEGKDISISGSPPAKRGHSRVDDVPIGGKPLPEL